MMDSLESVGTTVTVGSVAELANILANMSPEQLDNVQLDPILYNALVQTIESNPAILDTNNQIVDDGNSELNIETLNTNVKVLNSDGEVPMSNAQLLDSSTNILDPGVHVFCSDVQLLDSNTHMLDSNIQLLDPDAQFLTSNDQIFAPVVEDLYSLKTISESSVSISHSSVNMSNSEVKKNRILTNICQPNLIINDSQLSSSALSPVISSERYKSQQGIENKLQKAVFSSQMNEINHVALGEGHVSTVNQIQRDKGYEVGSHQLNPIVSHGILPGQSSSLIVTPTLMAKVHPTAAVNDFKISECGSLQEKVSTGCSNVPIKMLNSSPKKSDHQILHKSVISPKNLSVEKKNGDMIQSGSNGKPGFQVNSLKDLSGTVNQPPVSNHIAQPCSNMKQDTHIPGSKPLEQSSAISLNPLNNEVLYAIPIIASKSSSDSSKETPANSETSIESSSRIVLTSQQLSDLLAGNSGKQSFEGIIMNKGGESVLHLNSNTNVAAYSNIQIVNLDSPKIKHNKIIASSHEKEKTEHHQLVAKAVNSNVSISNNPPILTHTTEKVKKNVTKVDRKPQYIKAPSHSELVEIRNNVFKTAAPESISVRSPVTQFSPSSTISQASRNITSKLNVRTTSSATQQRTNITTVQENRVTSTVPVQQSALMHEADGKIQQSVNPERVKNKRAAEAKLSTNKIVNKDISPTKSPSNVTSQLDKGKTHNNAKSTGSLNSARLDVRNDTSCNENLKKNMNISSSKNIINKTSDSIQNENNRLTGNSPTKKKEKGDITTHGKFSFNRSFKKGSLDTAHSKTSIKNSLKEGENKYPKEVNEILHMREAIKSSHVGEGEIAMRQLAKLEIENQLKRFGRKVNMVKTAKEQRILSSPDKKVNQLNVPSRRKKQGADAGLYEDLGSNSQPKFNNVLKSDVVKQDEMCNRESKDDSLRKIESGKGSEDIKEQVRKRERPKKFDDFVLISKPKKEKKSKTRKFFFPEDFESKSSQKNVTEDYSHDDEVISNEKIDKSNVSLQHSVTSGNESKVLMNCIVRKEKVKSDMTGNEKTNHAVKVKQSFPQDKVSMKDKELRSSTLLTHEISKVDDDDDKSDLNTISQNEGMKDNSTNTSIGLQMISGIDVDNDSEKNIVPENLEDRSFMDAISSDTVLTEAKVKEAIFNLKDSLDVHQDAKQESLTERNIGSGSITLKDNDVNDNMDNGLVETSKCDVTYSSESKIYKAVDKNVNLEINKDDISIKQDDISISIADEDTKTISDADLSDEKNSDNICESKFLESKDDSISISDNSRTKSRKVLKKRKKKKATFSYEPEVLPAHLKIKPKITKINETVIDLSKVKQKNAFSESSFLLNDTVELETYKLLHRNSWLCSFCGRPGNIGNLDVLFGPYKVNIKDDNKKSDTMAVWVHRDCAVWTSTICISNQVLCGLGDALNAAAKMKCCLCMNVGATLQCSFRQCRDGYHYVCATQKGCSFNRENFTITCPKHR